MIFCFEAFYYSFFFRFGYAEGPGSCFANQNRLLVGIASYGSSSDVYLSTLLYGLDSARLALGVHVEVVLDLTQNLTFKTPDGIKIKVTYHNPDIQFHLAGKYRWSFENALASDNFDFFIMTENDLNITAENLESLCLASKFIAETHNDPQHSENNLTTWTFHKLMPGLVRYEKRFTDDKLKWLIDMNPLFAGPQILDVISIRGRNFIRPSLGYAATWFLSAQQLRDVIQETYRTGKHWLSKEFDSLSRPLYLREWYAGLWLKHFGQIMVIDLDNFHACLVHHLPDKYVRSVITQDAQDTFIEANMYFEEAKRWNSTPIYLNLKVPPR